jgi:hypothetical protein
MYMHNPERHCLYTSPCLSIYKRHGEMGQYMAVYGRGEQEENRRRKKTSEKTKVRVCVIDVIICKGS